MTISHFVHPRRTWPQLLLLCCVVVCAAGCRRNQPREDLAVRFEREGDEFFAKKNYADAEQRYSWSLFHQKRNGMARFKHARVLLQLGKRESARWSAVRAAELLPDSAEAQVLAARTVLLENRFVDALDYVGRVLKKHPADPSALVVQAEATAHLADPTGALTALAGALGDENLLLVRRNQLRSGVTADIDAEAEKQLRKAVDLAPDDLDIQLAFANFLWARGQIDEGEPMLRRAADAPGSTGLTNWALGMYYLARDRDAEGEAYLRKAVADPERGRDARFALADHLLARRRDTEAIEALDAMPAEDDARFQVSIRKAVVEARTGHHDRASAHLEKVFTYAKAELDREPESAEARELYGRALVAAGDLENGFDQLADAARRLHGPTLLGFELSRLAVELGRTPDALAFAREFARTNPNNPDGTVALSRALLLGGDAFAAEQELKGVLARRPTPEAVYLSGLVHEARGRRDLARAAFGRALQLDPEFLPALTALVASELAGGSAASVRQQVATALAAHPTSPSYLALAAQVFAAGKDTAHAEALLRQALGVDAGYQPAALQLADLLGRSRRFDDAIGVLGTLLERRPRSLDGKLAVAAVYEQAGNITRAREEYRKVLVANPEARQARVRLDALNARILPSALSGRTAAGSR